MYFVRWVYFLCSELIEALKGYLHEHIFAPAIGGSMPVGQQRHTEEALPKLADLKKRRHYLAAYCKLFAFRY